MTGAPPILLAMKNSIRQYNPLWVLTLPIGLFYLGWCKFLFDGETIYYFDYLFRLVVIALVIRIWGWDMLKDRPQSFGKAVFLVGLAVYGLSAVEYLGAGLEDLGLSPPVSLFPPIETDALKSFDLTVGIALVALSEEIVFRGAFVRFWQKFQYSEWSLYVTSGLAFGLLHAHQGLSGIILTAVSGTILMTLYRRTGSLWAPILAHYLLDVILFAGLGCDFGLGGCEYAN